MDDKKQDPRITKTQRSLVLALLSLLESQSFSKITINDICQEAMVSRSTFYSHFEDKYKLLKFCIDEVDRRIFDNSQHKEIRELLIELLNKMQENSKTLRNLISAKLDIELMQLFREHFIDIFKSAIAKINKNNDQELSDTKLEILAAFYSAGVSQTIMLWISNKLPISTEEIADILCDLLPLDNC